MKEDILNKISVCIFIFVALATANYKQRFIIKLTANETFARDISSSNVKTFSPNIWSSAYIRFFFYVKIKYPYFT